MVRHFFRRFIRRRRRTLFKRTRRVIVRRRIMRKKYSTKVARLSRKIKRFNKRAPIFKIARTLQPPHIIRKFSDVNFHTLTQSTISSANGIFAYDWLISDFCATPTQQYYGLQYYYCNLLALHITFWIERVVGFAEITNSGAALTNYYTTQNTKTTQRPELLVLACNSDTVQNGYGAITTASSLPLTAWYSNPMVQRLSQGQRATFQWHLNKGYYSTYVPTSGFTAGGTIDSVFAGPPGDEPHGFVCLWNDVAEMPGQASLVLGYKLEAIMAFKDRAPYAVGP